MVTGASFVILGAAWGTQASFGAFLDPLTEGMGWSRTAASAVFSTLTAVSFATGVLWGWLADRWGARPVIVATGLMMGLGVFLSGTVQALWQLYIFYGVIAGAGLGGMVGPISALVARWFDRRRGLAIAISYAGIGAGTAGLPILVEYLNSSHGWRQGFWGLGIILFAAVLLAGFLLREPRSPVESQAPLPSARGPQGEDSTADEQMPAGADAGVPSVTLSSALRTRSLWLMFLMEAAGTLIFFMVVVHLVSRATDAGVSSSTAVTLITVIGLAIIAGQPMGGALGDRFGPRRIFAAGLALCSLALVWLSLSNGLWMFYVFAAAFGLGTGHWSPQLPSVIARIFGTRHLGAIWGAVLLGSGVGGLIGPVMAGYIFDSTGSYRIAFSAAAAIGFAGVVLTLVLSDQPHPDRIVRE